MNSKVGNQKMRFGITVMLVCVATIAGLFFTDCGKSPFCSGKERNRGMIVELVDPGCPLGPEGREQVIESDSAFKAMFPNSNLIIDFSQYTLLGNSVSGSCDIKLSREVKKGTESYVYTIDVKECGICKKLISRCSWVTVPKLPAGWTVKFIVKKV